MDKVLYSCFLLFAGISAQWDLGDTCNFDVGGKCTLVKDCPIAEKLITSGINHGLKRCGWKGKKEIICCPSSEDRFRGPIRKIEEVCMHYAKNFSIDVQSFIHGGVKASLKEFPHMVALGTVNKLEDDNKIKWGDCGGSLISENFVLTAAHCLINANNKVPVMVRLGKIDLIGDDDNVKAQDIPVANSYAHPDYKAIPKINDIALLRLEKPVNLTDYVKPACLYTKNDTPLGLIVTGWGETESGKSSRFLLKAPMEPVELAKCQEKYQIGFTRVVETQLCARSGQDIPSDTCQGDSGGPIQLINRRDNNITPYIVIGVTAYGRGCAGGTPSVFTRVYDYLDWIESIVWPHT